MRVDDVGQCVKNCPYHVGPVDEQGTPCIGNVQCNVSWDATEDFEVGTQGWCLPRHGLPFNSRTEESKCV
jgi:hypothetical protein